MWPKIKQTGEIGKISAHSRRSAFSLSQAKDISGSDYGKSLGEGGGIYVAL